MIIWLNGAFGSGKTHTAYELQRRLPNAYVYDPENAGYFIRKNLPPCLREEDIIVPMTITNSAYYKEIIGTLAEKYDVKHFILYADKKTLQKRLASRLEGKYTWPARQIDRCIKAFDEEITEYKINTNTMSLYEVVEEVAALSGKTLNKDKRSRFRKFWDRFVTKCKHIR